MHNAAPEYRIAFWKELNKIVDLDIVITNKNIERKIYNLKKDTDNLNIKDWENSMLDTVSQYDAVILPPIESIKDYKIARQLRRVCINTATPFCYWTEKWIPRDMRRPLGKKIKDAIKTKMIKSASDKANSYIGAGTLSANYLHYQLKVSGDRIHVAYDSSTSPYLHPKINIRQRYEIPSQAKVILFLGRLITRKGCLELIHASLPILKKTNSYLIIGGEGEQLKLLKKEVGNNKRIIFVGKIQPNLRRAFYEQSTVFVLPSIAQNGIIEAWGLTVNEALECGLPVIATDAVGSAYDLINVDNGIVVANGNVEELQQALFKVLNKRYNKKRIKSDYEKKFSVKNMAQNFYIAIFK